MKIKFNFLVGIIFSIIILSVIIGSLTTFVILNINSESKEKLIKEFYLSETAVQVSPHHLRKAIMKGEDDFILVDLRSQEEYEREHIIGAVNIPAYKSPDKSAYGDVERIVNSFREIRENNPDKDLIVYCYSSPCMTGSKVGKMLAENEIYVQKLGIGWNEWKYFWNLWNHEHEWNQTNVENYIFSGSEPGKFIVNNSTNSSKVCPIEGDLGC